MPPPGRAQHPTYNASFSRREVALLAEWELARRRWVTIDDIRKASGSAAAKVASALVRKGALDRLKPGLYMLRPFRLIPRGSVTSSPCALAILLHAEPHYIGGLWALTQNRLTQQQYVSILDAFVARPHRGGAVPLAKVRFHVLPGDALALGVVEAAIEGMLVRMSGPERT